MKNNYKTSLTIIAAFFFAAIGFSQDYSNGIFILNEGLIGTETSSVSSLDENGILENNIFATHNGGMALGDTAQGMGLMEDLAYVVLNNSNEVKVINRTTFEYVASITDQIASPRYIAFYEEQAFVTNWGDPGNTLDDYVAIIDLATNTVIGTIPVAEGPEEIVQKDGVLFVAHQGGYGFGNTISVIDIATQAVSSLTVGDIPSSIKVDADYLYVLCSGNPNYSGNETSGKLLKIDLDDYSTVAEYTFPGLEHPSFLGLDEVAMYYVLDADIYKMSLTATNLPTSPFINTTSNNISIPYGFDKIEDKLYISDAIDFVSDGKVYVYNEDGTFSTDYTVGPLPNGFYKLKDETAAISDFATTSISLYPNPTSDNFRLNITEKASIKMFDVSGRMIKNTEYDNESISVAGLTAGVYLVQIEIEGKTTTQKLIVQ